MKPKPCNTCADFRITNRLTAEGVCPTVPVERRGITPCGACYVDRQLTLKAGEAHGDRHPAA